MKACKEAFHVPRIEGTRHFRLASSGWCMAVMFLEVELPGFRRHVSGCLSHGQ